MSETKRNMDADIKTCTGTDNEYAKIALYWMHNLRDFTRVMIDDVLDTDEHRERMGQAYKHCKELEQQLADRDAQIAILEEVCERQKETIRAHLLSLCNQSAQIAELQAQLQQQQKKDLCPKWSNDSREIPKCSYPECGECLKGKVGK